MFREREIKGISGWLISVALLVVLILSIWSLNSAVADLDVIRILGSLLVLILTIGAFFGLTVVNPNEARVVQLFGRYKGSLKEQGFWWINPLTLRRKVSLRIRNFESSKLKVNDHDGNPIEIAAVVVWRVIETAEAIFEVDDYEHFVHVQSEAAVRNLATSYPYDAHV